MFDAKCVYCGKQLENYEPCYFVFKEKVKIGYRHTYCNKESLLRGIEHKK